MPDAPTILFAGGGTGGHIFPNLAVIERLRDAMGNDLRAHLLVSDRAVDADIVQRATLPYTALHARPFGTKPAALWRCLRAYKQSMAQVRRIIHETRAGALIGTGGFVTAPALHAARRAHLPAALVNLDAVPGLASRWSARYATDTFTVYPHPTLPRAQPIGLPLRHAALASESAEAARDALGLWPERRTLLVTAGSQGAASINRAMIELVGKKPAVRDELANWQVLHLTGAADRQAVQAAYDEAGVPATVLAFCEAMGRAWAAADLAISRAGAGSVAEVWANRVPTVFLPYPHHRDEHQKLNAAPLIERGGALLLTDLADGPRNADTLAGPLEELLTDAERRQAMRDQLDDAPVDGAEVVAAWVRLALGQA